MAAALRGLKFAGLGSLDINLEALVASQGGQVDQTLLEVELKVAHARGDSKHSSFYLVVGDNVPVAVYRNIRWPFTILSPHYLVRWLESNTRSQLPDEFPAKQTTQRQGHFVFGVPGAWKSVSELLQRHKDATDAVLTLSDSQKLTFKMQSCASAFSFRFDMLDEPRKGESSIPEEETQSCVSLQLEQTNDTEKLQKACQEMFQIGAHFTRYGGFGLLIPSAQIYLPSNAVNALAVSQMPLHHKWTQVVSWRATVQNDPTWMCSRGMHMLGMLDIVVPKEDAQIIGKCWGECGNMFEWIVTYMLVHQPQINNGDFFASADGSVSYLNYLNLPPEDVKTNKRKREDES